MYPGKKKKKKSNDSSFHNGRSDNESGLDTLLLGLLFMQTSKKKVKMEEEEEEEEAEVVCVCNHSCAQRPWQLTAGES